MTTESCPLCGALNRETVFEARAGDPEAPLLFHLQRCTLCGLVMTEPRLTGAELGAHYEGEYWGRTRLDDPAWVRRDQRHRTAFLQRFLRQGRILDVGCGLGLFLHALDPVRWDRYGLELMPVPYQQAARLLGAERVVQRELAAASFPREHFDVVTFWDVLEHLPNPRQALEETFRILRPGGLVFITLPNWASYQARHFQEDWYALSLPHHLYHFTPQTLARLLNATSFRLRVLEDRFGKENYHSLKHSLLNRLTRRHGRLGGRARYYLLKPFLYPWEWLSTRLGGGSHLRVCAERLATRGQ